VRLQELGSLVECVELLALLGLFFVHDSFEGFALSAFLDALGPLVINLTELILCILAISLRLLLLLGLLAHFGIVRAQSFSVLLVSTIVLSQQSPLCGRVLSLHLEELSRQLVDCLLEILHSLKMSLIHGFLDLFTVGSQLIFPCVFLRAQLTLG
jgi:hypothetical protein